MEVPMLPRLGIAYVPRTNKHAGDGADTKKHNRKDTIVGFKARVYELSEWSGNQQPYGPAKHTGKCDDYGRENRNRIFHQWTFGGMPLALSASASESSFRRSNYSAPLGLIQPRQGQFLACNKKAPLPQEFADARLFCFQKLTCRSVLPRRATSCLREIPGWRHRQWKCG